MAVPLENTFEGGSDATTITTGNSGGASGDAFDTVYNPAVDGWGIEFENSPILSGTMSARIIPGTSNNGCQVTWGSGSVGTVGPNIYTRMYFRFPSAVPNSTLNERVIKLNSGASQRAGVVIFGSADTGRFSWVNATDSSGGTHSSMTLSADTTYRFECEFVLSATVGQVTIKCFAGDDTSPIETLASTATLNLGGTTADNVEFGYLAGSANSTVMPNMVIDGLGIDTAGYMGPVVSGAAPTLRTVQSSLRW